MTFYRVLGDSYCYMIRKGYFHLLFFFVPVSLSFSLGVEGVPNCHI